MVILLTDLGRPLWRQKHKLPAAYTWDSWELCCTWLHDKACPAPDSLCDPGQHLRSSGLRLSHHLHNQKTGLQLLPYGPSTGSCVVELQGRGRREEKSQDPDLSPKL